MKVHLGFHVSPSLFTVQEGLHKGRAELDVVATAAPLEVNLVPNKAGVTAASTELSHAAGPGYLVQNASRNSSVGKASLPEA